MCATGLCVDRLRYAMTSIGFVLNVGCQEGGAARMEAAETMRTRVWMVNACVAILNRSAVTRLSVTLVTGKWNAGMVCVRRKG